MDKDNEIQEPPVVV